MSNTHQRKHGQRLKTFVEGQPDQDGRRMTVTIGNLPPELKLRVALAALKGYTGFEYYQKRPRMILSNRPGLGEGNFYAIPDLENTCDEGDKFRAIMWLAQFNIRL